MRIIISLVFVVAILFAAIFLGSELNRTALGWKSEGSVTSGVKFGVSHGDALDDAIQSLRDKGFLIFSEGEDVGCRISGVDKPYYGVSLYDSSWRKAGICVAAVDGRVVGLSWWFNPFAP